MYTLLFGAMIAGVPLAALPAAMRRGSAPAARPVLTLRIHPEDMVMSIAISPDNRTVAAATQYGDWGGVEVWDLTSGGLRWATGGDNGGVESVAYSPDGRQLASGGEDGVLRLWNEETGKLRRRFGRRRLIIQSVAFSPDGRSLASAGGDPLEDQIAELKLWDVRTGRLRRFRRRGGDFLNMVGYLPAGNLLPSNNQQVGLLQVGDMQPGRRSWLVVGYDVASSQLSPDRKILAATEDGRTVELLDARTLVPLRELLLYNPDLRAMAFSPDGRTVATAAASGGDNRLELWDALTGNLQRSIRIYTRTVWSLAYRRGGRTLVSGGEDGALQFWDTRRGRLMVTLRLLSWPGDRSAAAQWVAFTPEGYYTGSPGIERFIRWRVVDQLFPGARLARLFHRPDLVQGALSEQSLPMPSHGPTAGVRCFYSPPPDVSPSASSSVTRRSSTER